MTGRGFHVHGERRRLPAEGRRSDARRVHFLEERLLERACLGCFRGASDLAQKRVLGKARHLVECGADAHADDERRAGVRGLFAHAVQHDLAHAV